MQYFIYDDKLEKIVSIQKKPVNYWNILLEKLKEVVNTVSANAIQNLDMIINNLGKGNFRYHPDDVVDALLCSENSKTF